MLSLKRRNQWKRVPFNLKEEINMYILFPCLYLPLIKAFQALSSLLAQYTQNPQNTPNPNHNVHGKANEYIHVWLYMSHLTLFELKCLNIRVCDLPLCKKFEFGRKWEMVKMVPCQQMVKEDEEDEEGFILSFQGTCINSWMIEGEGMKWRGGESRKRRWKGNERDKMVYI